MKSKAGSFSCYELRAGFASIPDGTSHFQLLSIGKVGLGVKIKSGAGADLARHIVVYPKNI